MPGNYDYPYRKLVSGSNVPTANPTNFVACELVDHWVNITRVRPKGDTSSPDPHYTAVPYKREDIGYALYEGDSCAVAGNCGLWTIRGDFGALPEHNIEADVPDITTCEPLPVVTVDNNCYERIGTVDNRNCHKVGGKWVLARKMWHGIFGWLSADACPDPYDESPDQTRYLSVTYDITVSAQNIGDQAYNLAYEYDWNLSGTTAIGRYTGLKSTTLDVVGYEEQYGGYPVGSLVFDKTITSHGAGTAHDYGMGITYNYLSGQSSRLDSYAGNSYYTCNSLPVVPENQFGNTGGGSPIPNRTLDGIVTWWYEAYGTDANFVPLPAVTDMDSYSETVSFTTVSGYTPSVTLEWERTATGFTWNFTFNDDSSLTGTGLIEEFIFSGSVTLGDPYTATDLTADLQAASNEYNLDNDKVQVWQAREDLANASLVIYDEVQTPQSPLISYNPVMDDYSGALQNDPEGRAPGDPGYITTWLPIAWCDSSDFIWLYPDNTFTIPGGFTGGATLLGAGQVVTGYPTHFYTGAIISHNPHGYDPHFWFGFPADERICIEDVSTGAFLGTSWMRSYNGGFSNSDGRHQLPETTLRWQPKSEAQTDPQLYSPSLPPIVFGNQPQSWYREINGIAYLGKYVETKVPWPSVNFGRPYGVDKWAVDNATACAIIAAGVIRKTGNAIDPLATGGLQVGDTVLVGGDGVYPITAITPTSGYPDWPISPRNQFTYTLGTKIADPASGGDITAGYLAKLRWWTAPPFGLTDISAVDYDAGANETTFTIPATPFWVVQSGAPMTLSVDLYTQAANGNPANGALATVTITKAAVGDTTVKCTGNYLTAKFLIPHTHYSGATFLPEYDDDKPKGDSLRFEWTFNRRGQSATTPPTWWEGQDGIIGQTVTAVRSKFVPCCPTVIGFGSENIEDFPNGNIGLLPIADLTTDSVYGAFWMGICVQNMDDPFWTAPFKEDLDEDSRWTMDDGYGHEDDYGTIPPTLYYAHAPQVEAIATKPTNLGWSASNTPPNLPSGVSLPYGAPNIIAPAYFPYGIPFGYASSCAGVNSDFTNLTTSYGFFNLACDCIANGRPFTADYQRFMYC